MNHGLDVIGVRSAQVRGHDEPLFVVVVLGGAGCTVVKECQAGQSDAEDDVKFVSHGFCLIGCGGKYRQ